MTPPLLHFQSQTLSRGLSTFEFPEIEINTDDDLLDFFGDDLFN